MRVLAAGAPGVVEVVDAPDPEPAAGEVVVRVEACGICGSDVHLVDAGAFAPGHVPGHELSGVVDQVGPAVDPRWVGRPVAVNPLGSCGRCAVCRRGLPFLCAARPNLGLGVPGGFAQFVAVPQEQLVALPDGTELWLGSRAEPLAVALAAVGHARPEPGNDAFVYGIGPIGLNVISALRLAGAGTIIAIGRSPGRRAAAGRLGADVVLDAGRTDPERWAGENGLRFGSAYECAGADGALASCLRMLAPGGSCVQVALGGDTVPGLDVDLLVGQGLRLTGSCAFSADTYAAAVGHLAAGRVSAEPLVSARVSLDAAPEAFVRLRNPGELVGVLVQPWW